MTNSLQPVRCRAVFSDDLPQTPKHTMTLTQLKKQVDAAYEYALDCHQSPDSIPVTLQLNRDGDEGDAICTHEDVEVHYDNNTYATGCVICATLSENA